MSFPRAAHFKVIGAALAVMLAAACGGGGGGGEPAKVATTITITPGPTASVQSGGTLQLTAVVKDQNGAVMENQTVTWSSSNNSKATVTQTGLVTGISVGATTINASVGTTVFASPVTVSVLAGAPASIAKFNELQTTMPAGSNDAVRARVFDAAGNPVSGATVTFAVSGAGATLSSTTAVTDASGIATVTLTVGPTAGVAVSVTATAPGLNTVTFTTTVSAGVPTTLRVTSPKVVVIDQGGTTTVTTSLVDAAGNPIATTSGIDYIARSGNVTVSSTGVITGTSSGQSIVVAQVSSNTAIRDSMLVVVAIPTGVVVLSDLQRFDFKADTIFTMSILVDMRSSGEKLGSTRVQLTWDPTVLSYQSDAEGSSSVGATVNNTTAATGSLTLAVASSAGFAGAVEIRRVTFRASNVAGRSTNLVFAATEMNGIAPTFTNLKPKTLAVSYPFYTR